MNRASIPWNSKQIAKMVENGSLTFDNAIQRNFVWDKARMSLLIDSMLRGYPIPPFYAIKTDRTIVTPRGEAKIYDCLDGKQRCNTVYKFRNNQFALTGLDLIASDEGEIDINGKTYEELPEDLRDAFDSYAMTVYGLTEITDEEVIEVMRRLNNGKPLSAIDITRIKAKDLAGLKAMSQHPIFDKSLTDKGREGRQQEDIIIKIWAILNNPEASLDNKDVRPLYETLEFKDDVERRIKTVLDTSLAVYDHLVDNESKATARKFVTKTHLIAMSHFIEKGLADGLDVETLSRFVDYFYSTGKPSKSERYNAACKNGSNHSCNVATRYDVLKRNYDWFLDDEDKVSEYTE